MGKFKKKKFGSEFINILRIIKIERIFLDSIIKKSNKKWKLELLLKNDRQTARLLREKAWFMWLIKKILNSNKDKGKINKHTK